MMLQVPQLVLNAIGLSLTFSSAGRVTVTYDDPDRDVYISLHILPGREFRFWGYRDSRDSTLRELGFGPFAMFDSWGI